MSTQPSTSQAESHPREISRKDGRTLFDRQGERYLGISGDEFLQRWDAGEYGDPDEPLDKDHRRATAGDSRAEPECPATGVDWYDAYAYAAWAGKDLPTEDQWERAARGDENQVYPWGDSFESNYLNWATHTYSMPIGTKDDWLGVLTSVDPTTLDTLATPVSQHPENTSPFGVMGLSGNTWEWTRTRYLDRAEFSPHFGTLEIGETFGNWAAYPTVKGGSWSSVADLLSPAFRAKKHLFTRSPEISFRCVVVEGA